MAERIYIAKPTDETQPARLIEAGSPAQVFMHLARAAWDVSPAGAYDVADVMGSAGRVEKAGEPIESADQAQLPGLSD